MTPENIREMYTAMNADPDGNGEIELVLPSSLECTSSSLLSPQIKGTFSIASSVVVDELKSNEKHSLRNVG